MKKTNNKGFSLVELIIVIAIMAVLIAVLAPQFLRYVERSRYQKDMSAVGELENAMKVAVSNETAVAGVTTWPVVATITNATGAVAWSGGVGTAFTDEVQATIMGAAATPVDLNFTSTTIIAATPDMTITITAGGVATLANVPVAP